MDNRGVYGKKESECYIKQYNEYELIVNDLNNLQIFDWLYKDLYDKNNIIIK